MQNGFKKNAKQLKINYLDTSHCAYKTQSDCREASYYGFDISHIFNFFKHQSYIFWADIARIIISIKNNMANNNVMAGFWYFSAITTYCHLNMPWIANKTMEYCPNTNNSFLIGMSGNLQLIKYMNMKTLMYDTDRNVKG